MKRVGIATFHFADSYGALLQCYALRRVIDRLPDITAEVIDYRPIGYQCEAAWTGTALWKGEYEKRLALQKLEKLEAFRRKYLNLSAKRSTRIDGAGYDYCCVGSDQVWNPDYLSSGAMEYLLPNVPAAVNKISYGASIGYSPKDRELPLDLYKEYLPSFRALSVRELEHAEMISELTGKRCACVLDPTLLLNAEEYLPLIDDKAETQGPYLLLFWIGGYDLDRGIELANRIARKYKLGVIHSIRGAKRYLFYHELGCMYEGGVEDFLGYVKNAAYVVTNSYHATIFSLHFERPFYAMPDGRRSRLNSLCARLGFGDRIVGKMLVDRDICEEIDFTGIRAAIERERDASLRFLKSALDTPETAFLPARKSGGTLI